MVPLCIHEKKEMNKRKGIICQQQQFNFIIFIPGADTSFENFLCYTKKEALRHWKIVKQRFIRLFNIYRQ
jgi:hypothetical protein